MSVDPPDKSSTLGGQPSSSPTHSEVAVATMLEAPITIVDDQTGREDAPREIYDAPMDDQQPLGSEDDAPPAGLRRKATEVVSDDEDSVQIIVSARPSPPRFLPASGLTFLFPTSLAWGRRPPSDQRRRTPLDWYVPFPIVCLAHQPCADSSDSAAFSQPTPSNTGGSITISSSSSQTIEDDERARAAAGPSMKSGVSTFDCTDPYGVDTAY